MGIQRRNHLDRGFYNNPSNARMTMTTQQLQETMMYTEGSITAMGFMWDIQKKNLAPGVWLITLKKAGQVQSPRLSIKVV